MIVLYGGEMNFLRYVESARPNSETLSLLTQKGGEKRGGEKRKEDDGKKHKRGIRL